MMTGGGVMLDAGAGDTDTGLAHEEHKCRASGTGSRSVSWCCSPPSPPSRLMAAGYIIWSGKWLLLSSVLTTQHRHAAIPHSSHDL